MFAIVILVCVRIWMRVCMHQCVGGTTKNTLCSVVAQSKLEVVEVLKLEGYHSPKQYHPANVVLNMCKLSGETVLASMHHCGRLHVLLIVMIQWMPWKPDSPLGLLSTVSGGELAVIVHSAVTNEDLEFIRFTTAYAYV